MRILIQECLEAKVTIEKQVVSQIEQGEVPVFLSRHEIFF